METPAEYGLRRVVILDGYTLIKSCMLGSMTWIALVAQGDNKYVLFGDGSTAVAFNELVLPEVFAFLQEGAQ